MPSWHKTNLRLLKIIFKTLNNFDYILFASVYCFIHNLMVNISRLPLNKTVVLNSARVTPDVLAVTAYNEGMFLHQVHSIYAIQFIATGIGVQIV